MKKQYVVAMAIKRGSDQIGARVFFSEFMFGIVARFGRLQDAEVMNFTRALSVARKSKDYDVVALSDAQSESVGHGKA